MTGTNPEDYMKACADHPDIYGETFSATNEMGGERNPRLHLITHAIVLDQIEEVTVAKNPYEEPTDRRQLGPLSTIHVQSNALYMRGYRTTGITQGYERKLPIG
ncbi:hypothetical protein KGY64_03175 [Candidatus Bipolaricaulota bacterium]|nr:hypothetical protein [Candidatus Bipolaricaulota bacterium]